MRVVMTGGTAGIGLAAARTLMAADGVDLVVGARGAAKGLAGTGATVLPLDLADLVSVRRFADALGPAPIDALLLNAGIGLRRDARSAQGFDLTFAVNHLAHHLLLRLLLDRLAERGRVVITTSLLHDERAKFGAAPRHGDAMRLASPERDSDRPRKAGKAAQYAYAASKLCNAMTAWELARRTAQNRPRLMIAAFDPGFAPGTELSREYPAVLRWLIRNVLPRLMRGPIMATPQISGACLAALVIDPAYAGARGDYWAVRGNKLKLLDPSPLARDEGACAKLWDDSVPLVDGA
jgi:NAD(P)-dependent dehydrogenase (short-subunit alcohol dehydrogenase family)